MKVQRKPAFGYITCRYILALDPKARCHLHPITRNRFSVQVKHVYTLHTPINIHTCSVISCMDPCKRCRGSLHSGVLGKMWHLTLARRARCHHPITQHRFGVQVTHISTPLQHGHYTCRDSKRVTGMHLSNFNSTPYLHSALRTPLYSIHTDRTLFIYPCEHPIRPCNPSKPRRTPPIICAMTVGTLT